MSKFKVTGIASVEVVTEVEADNWKEAEKIAADRELDICIHGSEFADGLNPIEFTLTDGTYYSITNLDAEEIE